jgi:transcriptional regulator with XRE-family HTH domain
MSNQNRKASPELRHRLAINLKKLREARGYTQMALARRSGINHGYISKVERELKNLTLANLEALAIALGCSEADLLWPVKQPAARRGQP